MPNLALVTAYRFAFLLLFAMNLRVVGGHYAAFLVPIPNVVAFVNEADENVATREVFPFPDYSEKNRAPVPAIPESFASAVAVALWNCKPAATKRSWSAWAVPYALASIGGISMRLLASWVVSPRWVPFDHASVPGARPNRYAAPGCFPWEPEGAHMRLVPASAPLGPSDLLQRVCFALRSRAMARCCPGVPSGFSGARLRAPLGSSVR